MTTQPDVTILDDDQRAGRALAILAQVVCPYTDQPVDFSVGHCGDDLTHPHCPFCGSGEECAHLLAQWCDDFGYSGPDIPLVPEEWSVPADWTESQLHEILGDLQPAFKRYAELQDLYEGYVQYEVALDLAEALKLEIHPVSWCSDGRPASIGNVCYAADGNAAAEQLAGAGSRLEAAITRLSALRNPDVPSGPEDLDK